MTDTAAETQTSYPITEARTVFGVLVRRAALGRERITITDHGHPAAILVSPQELADLEDAAALADYRLRKAAGTSHSIPQTEARRMLGLDK